MPVVTQEIRREIQIVDRFEERLVDVVREISTIKEVRIVEQVPVEQIRYIEVERIVNNFINVPQIVEIKEQIAVPVNTTIEKPVDIIHTFEKIVQVINVEERLVEVPVEKNITLVQEVPTPYREEVTHIVKGDREEVILEVERIVEKPIVK